VRGFFAALEAEDWMGALALCADEIRYYPLSTSPAIAARLVGGKDAYLAFLMRAAQHYTLMRFTDLRLYLTPKGLAARYICHWVTPEDTRERRMVAALFRFAGERITCIGARMILRASTFQAGMPRTG
jgi:ketosteroid isomerase-like protein